MEITIVNMRIFAAIRIVFVAVSWKIVSAVFILIVPLNWFMLSVRNFGEHKRSVKIARGNR